MQLIIDVTTYVGGVVKSKVRLTQGVSFRIVKYVLEHSAMLDNPESEGGARGRLIINFDSAQDKVSPSVEVPVE